MSDDDLRAPPGPRDALLVRLRELPAQRRHGGAGAREEAEARRAGDGRRHHRGRAELGRRHRFVCGALRTESARARGGATR